MAGDHDEYDMDLAHVKFFVAFSGGITPKLQALSKAMEHPTEKTRISQLIPGTHKILGPALGAYDPLSEHSFVMKQARAEAELLPVLELNFVN